MINGVLNHDLAAKDCTAAADPYVDFRSFVGINLMFNGDLDGYAWGGTWWMTLDGQSKLWYMTWEPPWGYTDITVIAHEMGHGFGLPHSSGDYSPNPVYDNAWDVMSDVWSYCNLLYDASYGCLAQGTISYHKDKLGWIPAAQRFVATVGQNTVTLERLAQSPATGYRIIQIPIPNSTASTLQSRASGWDMM